MRISRVVIPLLVVAALFGGWILRAAFTHPTTTVAFASRGTAQVTCTVDGVRCKGTATFFTNLYKNVPGIASIETYAGEHRAVIRFDPAVISPQKIREVMESPVPLRDGSSRQVFRCLEMKES